MLRGGTVGRHPKNELVVGPIAIDLCGPTSLEYMWISPGSHLNDAAQSRGLSDLTSPLQDLEASMVTIHVAGVHYHVSDKTREHIEEKFGSLNRFHKGLSSVHVTIHHDEKKDSYRVDVDMHLPTGKDVIAHDTENNLFTAIDVTSDKCAAQLRKIHGKEIAHEASRMRA